MDLEMIKCHSSKQGSFYQNSQASFEIKSYLSSQHEIKMWELSKIPALLWKWCLLNVLHKGYPTPSVRGCASVLTIPAQTLSGNTSPAVSSWPLAPQRRIFLAPVIRALVPNKEKSRNWFALELLKPGKSAKSHGAGHRKGEKKTHKKPKWSNRVNLWLSA